MAEMSSMDPHAPCFTIPPTASTVAGFRAWKESSEFPERGRIDFCDGEVFVDMSPERVETHVLVKGAIYRALADLVDASDLGVILPDGATFTSESANLVTEPDGMFVRSESFREGRVHGGHEGDNPLGFCGAVDWILEVVSPSSVRKDRQRWCEKYAEAGVQEYWVVDARKDPVGFDVFVLADGHYGLQPEIEGWRESDVFRKFFRLEREPRNSGFSRFTLAAR